jgi:hypothetical protein
LASTPFDPVREFGWDCEHPKREVEVEAFNMEVLLVKHGKYLDWLTGVEEGEKEKLTPLSCAVGEGGLEGGKLGVKTLFGVVEMAYSREWPLAASAEQLEAFAKVRPPFPLPPPFPSSSLATVLIRHLPPQHKNGRLPTASEMALFHSLHPVETPLSNLGFANLHPVPPTPPLPARDGSTLPATDGGLWQWSSSVFERWEGYVGSEVYRGTRATCVLLPSLPLIAKVLRRTLCSSSTESTVSS